MVDCRIYGLVDPKTDELRYVGCTTDPDARKRQHLSATGTISEKTKLGSWIRRLRRFGQTPKLVWMERCEDPDLMHIAEEFWIHYHRTEMGTDLLNVLPGGPTLAKVCFVVPLNGYVAHDGLRWRLDALIKPSTLKWVAVDSVGSVWGFDRVPDEAEVFEREGLHRLNTYVPPKVQPTPGAHPGIDQLLRYLTDGDTDGIRYLTHWLARKVQDPGRPNMTAVVLQGQPSLPM